MTARIDRSHVVDTIASAPALGGATVKATHIAATRTIRVRCTRCGPLTTDTYPEGAPRAEVLTCRRNANTRAFVHATGCTAGRRTLADATREQS